MPRVGSARAGASSLSGLLARRRTGALQGLQRLDLRKCWPLDTRLAVDDHTFLQLSRPFPCPDDRPAAEPGAAVAGAEAAVGGPLGELGPVPASTASSSTSRFSARASGCRFGTRSPRQLRCPAHDVGSVDQRGGEGGCPPGRAPVQEWRGRSGTPHTSWCARLRRSAARGDGATPCACPTPRSGAFAPRAARSSTPLCLSSARGWSSSLF
jgi:hypothetical protein